MLKTSVYYGWLRSSTNNVLLLKIEGPMTGILSIIITCCKKKVSFKRLYSSTNQWEFGTSMSSTSDSCSYQGTSRPARRCATPHRDFTTRVYGSYGIRRLSLGFLGGSFRVSLGFGPGGFWYTGFFRGRKQRENISRFPAVGQQSRPS